MTIALALKVSDGLVLTADSATTYTGQVDGQDKTETVFNNEQKITHLHSTLPIGFMTWGVATLSGHSINWHAKEIRARFDGSNDRFSDWEIDKKNYELADVAQKVFQYFDPIFPKPEENQSLGFGILIGGYSSNSGESEVWTCVTSPTSVFSPPILSMPKERNGALWFGQPEAITRLVSGISMKLPAVLGTLGVDSNLIGPYVERIVLDVKTTLIWDPMPIQDAIDLATFLTEASINFSRFSAGANTVGGPIDVAAITRHEGFKWVNRKHYYPIHLNQKGAN